MKTNLFYYLLLENVIYAVRKLQINSTTNTNSFLLYFSHNVINTLFLI